MSLRLHPVSAERWARLAQSRHPIDLTIDDTEAPATTARSDRGVRRVDELVRIAERIEELAGRHSPVNR